MREKRITFCRKKAAAAERKTQTKAHTHTFLRTSSGVATWNDGNFGKTVTKFYCSLRSKLSGAFPGFLFLAYHFGLFASVYSISLPRVRYCTKSALRCARKGTTKSYLHSVNFKSHRLCPSLGVKCTFKFRFPHGSSGTGTPPARNISTCHLGEPNKSSQ